MSLFSSDLMRPTLGLGAGAAAAAAIWAAPADAIVIEGIQVAAVEIPRIHAAISLPSDPLSPLTAGEAGFETFNIQAFYDTGASGVLVSKETADAIGLPRAAGVEFGDVGVGGTAFFDVSEEVLVSLAPFTAPLGGGADIDNPATFDQTYSQKFGPLRTQIAQQNSDSFAGGLDVFGMPLFQQKTVTMDPRRVNGGALEFVEVNVYDSGSVPTDVPAVDLNIQTSYSDFSRFTTTTGGAGPTLSDNPFIGGDPFAADADTGPRIAASYGGATANGSWLFDTGAQTSILSEVKAAELGVTYNEASLLTEDPFLDGVPLADQFQLQIGGVGGTTTVAGFLLDALTLPTVEGEPITYTRAPVLVFDIAVEDPDTNEEFTLDGILGMNVLFPSFDIGNLEAVAGAWNFIKFDHPSGLLSLSYNIEVIPEPAAGMIVIAGVGALLGRRRTGARRG